jgi:hypothetical protein
MCVLRAAACAVDQTADFPPQQEPRQRKCSNPYRWIGSLLAIAIAAVLLGVSVRG